MLRRLIVLSLIVGAIAGLILQPFSVDRLISATSEHTRRIAVVATDRATEVSAVARDEAAAVLDRAAHFAAVARDSAVQLIGSSAEECKVAPSLVTLEGTVKRSIAIIDSRRLQPREPVPALADYLSALDKALATTAAVVSATDVEIRLLRSQSATTVMSVEIETLLASIRDLNSAFPKIITSIERASTYLHQEAQQLASGAPFRSAEADLRAEVERRRKLNMERQEELKKAKKIVESERAGAVQDISWFEDYLIEILNFERCVVTDGTRSRAPMALDIAARNVQLEERYTDFKLKRSKIVELSNQSGRPASEMERIVSDWSQLSEVVRGFIDSVLAEMARIRQKIKEHGERRLSARYSTLIRQSGVIASGYQRDLERLKELLNVWQRRGLQISEAMKSVENFRKRLSIETSVTLLSVATS